MFWRLPATRCSRPTTPARRLRAAASWAPDVALIHVECCGRASCGDIKSDPVAYGTAVIMIERPELSPEAAVDGMRRGVQDYLVEPVADGEVLTRVEAASRTKELQQELVAQGARLEALLREDALTGLSNRRAILTQLAGMVSGARRHGHPLSIAVLRPRPLQARQRHARAQGRRRGAGRRRARDGHPPACGGPARAASAARSSSSCCPTRTRTRRWHVAERMRAEVAARADAACP